MMKQVLLVAAALTCSVVTVCLMVVGVAGVVDPALAGCGSALSYGTIWWCGGS